MVKLIAQDQITSLCQSGDGSAASGITAGKDDSRLACFQLGELVGKMLMLHRPSANQCAGGRTSSCRGFTRRLDRFACQSEVIIGAEVVQTPTVPSDQRCCLNVTRYQLTSSLAVRKLIQP